MSSLKTAGRFMPKSWPMLRVIIFPEKVVHVYQTARAAYATARIEGMAK